MDVLNVMLDRDAFMPVRAHSADAGYDLRSTIGCVLDPGCSVKIDTGVHMQIPEGYAGFLKSKSGLNVKYGLQNEGLIDSGYTGSIVVKLYNHGKNRMVIEKGDKISQIVIIPVATPELRIVDRLAETERGDNGFGSTGR